MAKTATAIIPSIDKPIIFQNVINFKTVIKDLAQQCMTKNMEKFQINHQNN